MLSKFTSYRDFHTQLYTCSPEFDFLPLDYLMQLTATLLFPAAVITVVVLCLYLFQNLFSSLSHGQNQSTMADPVLALQAYHLLQCGAFSILAILIMRLKLLLTTQLCILVALLARAKVCVHDFLHSTTRGV